jgi:membrane protease subunit HflK
MPRESLMLTDDENIIDIQFAVQYRLKNASEWIFNNRDQEETVKQVAETAIREIVGKSKMDFVLYEGREKVAYDTSALMQQTLDKYRIGVLVTNVTMQGVQPPEQVQASFDDAVKAGQDRERQKNEGQAYANDVVPKARGAASRLMQESEGYRSRVIANAQGEANRFSRILVEYQKSPGIMRDRMYIEAMQQIFASTTKVMVDAKNNNSMIYLPLDKLIAQTAAESAAAYTAPVQTAPVEASPEMGRPFDRNRDARSSRDRETR